MRLDLYLKASRLVIRRSVAQELCEAGNVILNGTAARSSRTVRVGDELSIRRASKKVTVRVTSLPTTKQVAREAAADLYEVLSEENTDAPC